MKKLFFLILLPTLVLAGPGGVGGGNGDLTRKAIVQPLGPGGVGGGNSISMKEVDQLLILNEMHLEDVLSIKTIDGEVLSVEEVKAQFSFEGKIILPENSIIDIQLVNGKIVELNQFKTLVTPSYFCDPGNFTDDCHHY